MYSNTATSLTTSYPVIQIPSSSVQMAPGDKLNPSSTLASIEPSLELETPLQKEIIDLTEDEIIDLTGKEEHEIIYLTSDESDGEPPAPFFPQHEIIDLTLDESDGKLPMSFFHRQQPLKTIRINYHLQACLSNLPLCTFCPGYFKFTCCVSLHTHTKSMYCTRIYV
jgi:hypothetical protein